MTRTRPADIDHRASRLREIAARVAPFIPHGSVALRHATTMAPRALTSRADMVAGIDPPWSMAELDERSD